jgi:hypothetical protein
MTHTSLDAPRLTWRARLQNAFAVVLVATLATGAAGCSSSTDSSTSPTNGNVAGEYLLETIQSKSLPVKIYDGPIGNPKDDNYYRSFVVTVKRGAIDLDGAGNYRRMVDYRLIADGEITDGSVEDGGTYEINGDRIVLTRDDGIDGGSGTVLPGELMVRMTIVDTGAPMQYVFRQ